jgi:signal transduction histidine kinase/CheY-like chemotaxis protein
MACVTKSFLLVRGIPFHGRPDHANTSEVGASVLSRPDAVCEHCLVDTCTARDNDGSGRSLTTPGLIIPDCRLDPRFATRTYVAQEPAAVRFYAGVPIVSRNGLKIGAYAVSDETPRDGLTVDELQFMHDVARAVTEHLEWARDRVDRFKGERIVRGLAAFIEGCSTHGDGHHHHHGSSSPPSSPNKSNDGSSLESSTAGMVRPSPLTLVAGRKRPPARSSSRREAAAAATTAESKNTPSPSPISDQEQRSCPSPPPSSSSSSSPPLSASPPSPTPLTSKPANSNANNTAKADSLTRMYQRAADILRHSTLADGVVFFGAQAAITTRSSSPSSRSPTQAGGPRGSDDEDHSFPGTSGSEGLGNSSDSDASPSARPCNILAYALASDQARADIEQGTALSLGTLERYFNLFPRGKTFSFTEHGSGVSSEDDSASDRERHGGNAGDGSREGDDSNGAQGQGSTDGAHGGSGTSTGRRRKPRMDHRELLKKIPGAKSVVFLPLFDHAEDRLAGGCFLWTSVTGRMMNLDEDLSYLRAFGNSIMSQVGRITTQKNEAAKTTFIASMSHELRSPLHGILGAAEFLMDNAGADAYQAALVNSIYTCGKTLLDTLNHVLDYSKINRLGRAQLRRGARQNRQAIKLSSDSLESLNMTAVVDLATLVEEVVDAIAAGHVFQKMPSSVLSSGPGAAFSSSSYPLPPGVVRGAGPDAQEGGAAGSPDGPVALYLDICPTAARLVRTQPGALRRIVMNLFGNALKYTTSGHIVVSVRAQPNSSARSSKVDAVIRVADTGKGMSDDFQRNRLFVPFSQEDSFQPGTGLGLSIVKQIVDSLGGSLDVCSQQGVGTEINVRLSLAVDTEQQQQPAPAPTRLEGVKRGLHLRLLDGKKSTMLPSSLSARSRNHKLDDILRDTCTEWFDMKISTQQDINSSPADLVLYSSPPSAETLRDCLEHNRRSNTRVPVVVLCPNAEEAIRFSQSQVKSLTDFSKVVEVIPQPCGPKKLAKVFQHCFRRPVPGSTYDGTENSKPLTDDVPSPFSETALPTPPEEAKAVLVPEPLPIPVEPLPSPPDLPAELGGLTPNESPPPLDPASPGLLGSSAPASPEIQGQLAESLVTKKPHVLLVDDNKINLQLLVMFVKKCGFSYAEAENGQVALDRFEEVSHGGSSSSDSSSSGVDDATVPIVLVDNNDASSGSSNKVDDTNIDAVALNRGERGFDFILMDISMPVMNGIEATRRIRELERTQNIPSTTIIALTGLASADAQKDAKRAGVDIFMPKPVRFAELKKLLVSQAKV